MQTLHLFLHFRFGNGGSFYYFQLWSFWVEFCQSFQFILLLMFLRLKICINCLSVLAICIKFPGHLFISRKCFLFWWQMLFHANTLMSQSLYKYKEGKALNSITWTFFSFSVSGFKKLFCFPVNYLENKQFLFSECYQAPNNINYRGQCLGIMMRTKQQISKQPDLKMRKGLE